MFKVYFDSLIECAKQLESVEDSINSAFNVRLPQLKESINSVMKYGYDYSDFVYKAQNTFNKATEVLSEVIKLAKDSYIYYLVNFCNISINDLESVFRVEGLEWLIDSIPDYNDSSFYYFDMDNIISAGTFDQSLNIRNINAERDCLNIYFRLINDYHYTHDFAIAVLNNMSEESAFDPSSTNLASGQDSVGLCHWRNSGKDNRLDQLLEFAIKKGVELGDYSNLSDRDKAILASKIDLDTQVDFMAYEIETRFNKNVNPNLNDYQDLYGQAYGNTKLDKIQQSRDFTIVFEAPLDYNAAATRRVNNTSDIEKLIEANRLKNTGVNRIESSNMNTYNNDNNDNSVDSKLDDLSSEILDFDSVSVDSGSYVVKPGQSLDLIARELNTTWEELFNKNRDIISDPNSIYPGLKLKI